MATNKRGRTAKSALNQKKYDANEMTSNNDMEMNEGLYNNDLDDEVKELTHHFDTLTTEETDIEKNDEKVEVDIDAVDFPTEPEGSDLSEAPEQPKEPEMDVEKPKIRTLADLSTSELRNFHRTGKMPQ